MKKRLDNREEMCGALSQSKEKNAKARPCVEGITDSQGGRTMEQRIRRVQRGLKKLIRETAEVSWLFSKRPGQDFTRKSKLGFEKTISILLAMEGRSIRNELLEYFNCSENTPSASAFIQCRNKLLPEAMETIFHRFAESFGAERTYKGYRLLAVDGSDIHIPTNPDDEDSFFPSKNGSKVYNLMHLNAMYDLLNNTYTDAIVEGSQSCDEQRALARMVDRSPIHAAILTADRGFEGYNSLAHVQEKKWKFLFRIKDGAGGIVSGLDLPSTEEFDVYFDMHLTRKQTNETKQLLKDRNRYKKLIARHQFDFFPARNRKAVPVAPYALPFRVVRFKVSDFALETVITNLDPDTFPPSELKKLYAMRWGIETSFRSLKYTLGLLHFHAKKVEHILQEIFARLIMYNFSELITSHVVIQKGCNKYVYKTNFSAAVHICRKIFLGTVSPPQAETLITKTVSPVRPGRSSPRSLSSKSTVSFIYRIA